MKWAQRKGAVYDSDEIGEMCDSYKSLQEYIKEQMDDGLIG